MRTIVKSFLLVVMLFATSTPLIAQSLISIDPDNALEGESLGVGISGQNTNFDQASTISIWFSQGSSTIYAYGYFPVNDTYMTAWFDLPSGAIGLHDLNVYNNIDGTLTLDNSFTINSFNPPELIAISPNSVQQGQVLRVAISGQYTHFNFQQGSNTNVWFSQGSPTCTCTNFWIISDTLLFAEFDCKGASLGLRDLNVYNDIDGTLTLYDSFTITPYNPTLTSITPGGAYQGQKLSVRISGQNTRFGFTQGSGALVWLSQGNSLIVSRQANAIGEKIGHPGSGITVADFDIPADANTGMWDVHTFSDIDGQLTLTDGFMIVQPGDWTSDGVVNFLDLAVLGNNWLEGAGP
ncbi:MAG: hypothetical protein FVQ85_03240 [Planctomycetes bacterium]|nr:hypothetical protein [Planctomycetota bacterium]